MRPHKFSVIKSAGLSSAEICDADFFATLSYSQDDQGGTGKNFVETGRTPIFASTDKFLLAFFRLLVPTSFGLSRSRKNPARVTAVPKLK